MEPNARCAPDERTFDERLPGELAELATYVRRLAASVSWPIEPQDLVQDVIERALRYRHTFDPTRALQPWLRRVALRVFLDQREHWRRVPQSLHGEPAVTDSDRAAERDDVARLLADLSPTERAVLQRFHVDGWSVAEIAAERELPEGTVKSHLHRARRRLAERVRKEQHP